jgi:aminoglycoside 3-N-acetyltransferase
MAARLAVTLDRLVEDFRALGLKESDRLALHSSLKSIGFVLGGPETVIRALTKVVGPEGTILMPAFSRPAPRFVMTETPSRTGLITETFRQMPGVIRSPHPTHSVAVWGRDAEAIAAGHERASGLGVDSPFHRLAKTGGLVIFLGCDSRSSSIIHVAEALARVPYLEVCYPGYDIPMTVVYADGRERVREPSENPGDSSAFLVVEENLRRRGLIHEGLVGQARTMVMKGTDIIETALLLLRRDPVALLCQRPECPVCPRARLLAEKVPEEPKDPRAGL